MVLKNVTRLRKIATRIAWVLGGLVAFVLVALLVIAGLLQTDWGRNQVRMQIEDRVGEQLLGELSIASIEGNLLSGFSLHDVELRDREGELVLSAEEVAVDYRLVPALGGEFRISELLITRPKLYLVEDEAGWNVMQLLPEEEVEKESTLELSIGSLEIRDGLVVIESTDRSEQIRDLDLEGDVWISGEDRRGAIRRASIQTSLWPNTIDLAARAEVSPMMMIVEQATLRSGGSSIQLRDLRMTRGDNGRLFEASVHGDISAKDMRRLTAMPGWQAAVHLDARVEQEQPDAPLAVRGAIRAASAQLELTAAIDLPQQTADLQMSLAGLDPSTLADELPAARLAAEVEGTVQNWSEWQREGQASASASMSGSIQGRPIENMMVHGRLREGIADAEVEIKTEGIAARGSAELDLREQPIRVRKSNLVADINLRAVRALAPLEGNAAGTVRLSAQAQGPFAALQTTGEARARGLRYGDMRAQKLDGRWTLELGGDVPRGTANVQARAVQVGEQRLGKLDADLKSQGPDRLHVQLAVSEFHDSAARVQALVIREDQRIVVQLPKIWLESRDLIWRGKVDALHLDDDGGVAVRGLALQSNAGSVQGSAQWNTSPLGIPARARLRMEGMKLEALSRVVDGSARAQVTGTASVALDIQGAKPLQLQIELRDVARRGTPGQIDASLALNLPRARGGTWRLDVDAGDNGRLRGQGTLALQRSWRLPAAWKTLGPASVGEVTLDADDLKLRALGRIIDVEMMGTVDASFTATNGFREAQLDLQAQDLFLRRWMAEPMNADIELGYGGGSLKTDARIVTRAAGSMRAFVDLEVGSHPLFEVGGLLEIDQVKRAQLQLDKVELATFARPFPEWRDLSGQVSACLVLDPPADTAQLSLSGDDLELGRFEFGAWRLGIEVDSTAKGSEIDLHASPDARPFLMAEMQLPITLSALLAGDQGWRGKPVRGRVQVPSVSLARMGFQRDEDAPRRPTFGGQFSADFKLAGTFNDPRVNGSARGREMRYGDVPLPALTMQARADMDRARLEIELEDRRQGTLRAHLSGNPGRQELDVRFEAEKFDVAFLNPLFLQARIPVASLGGKLQGKGALHIAGKQHDLSGRFTFLNGTISLPQPLESLHSLEAAVTLHTEKIVARMKGASRSGTVHGKAELHLKNLRPQSLTASVKTDDLPLTIRGAGIVASIEANLAAEVKNKRWNLQVNLAGGDIYLPSLPQTEELHPIGQLEDVVIVGGEEEREAGQQGEPRGWNIRVVTDKNVRVHGDDLDVELEVEFDIAQAEELTVEGSLRVPRGEVEILDRKYRVEEARVVLEEGEPRPHIYVRVAREFSQAAVVVTVSGYPDELELELTAQPSIYSRNEILSLIVKGAPSAAAGSPNRDQAVLSAIAGLASQQITARLREPLGVDTLTVGTGEGGSVSSVAVGKWITEAIFVAYHREFETDPTKNQDEVRLEWWLSGDWLVEMRAGDAGAGSGDLLWIFRY